MFFKHLGTVIKNLNSNLNDVVNSEKAKELRKKLIKIGSILLIIGIVSIVAAFTMFIIGGTNMAFDGFSPLVIVGSVLIIPSFIAIAFGIMLIHYGLAIIITGYTTNVIDTSVGERCPKCGDPISAGEIYCTKCGEPLAKKCPSCGHANSVKSDYCEKCGTKLG